MKNKDNNISRKKVANSMQIKSFVDTTDPRDPAFILFERI